MSPAFDIGVPPYRLTGTVYGTLLNDPATLAQLGPAVHEPPYKAPPRAPVLYLKPRHTLAPTGSAVEVPPDGAELEIGATVGLVIGRAACRVRVEDALAHVSGCILVADLCVPHRDVYRPSVRLRARDSSCLIGPVAAPMATVGDPARIELTVSVDGRRVPSVAMSVMQRDAAQLLHEVTDFMTLRAGDVLLMGLAADAPRVAAGQRFAIEAPHLGRLDGRLASATPPHGPREP